jgi:hypothetical protein
MDVQAPAPWQLRGSGYVFIFLGRDRSLDGEGPPGFDFVGGLGVVMLLDYTESDAGPYRELLFVPGSFQRRRGGGRFYSVTRIYVSSMASVTNGRRNWAIPKELAKFEIGRDGRDEHVRVTSGGRPFFEARISRSSLALPMTGALIPASRRTLCQHRDGNLFFTAPTGSGRVTLARIRHATIDERMFPDFRRFGPLLSLHVGDLRLRFPVAVVETASSRSDPFSPSATITG